MAELMNEILYGAQETTKGVTPVVGVTTVLAMTHHMNFEEHTLTRRPTNADLRLKTGKRSNLRKRRLIYDESVMEASGDLDVRQLPFLLSMVMGNPVTTTPGGATLTRNHLFTADGAADTSRSVSWVWGDPDIRLFQAAYHMADELIISFGADSDEFVQNSLTTVGQGMTFVEGANVPAAPTPTDPQPLIGINMDVWIDNATNPIGTTSINAKSISGELTIPRMRSRKRHATGVNGARTFDRVAPGTDDATLSLVLELDDIREWNMIRGLDEMAVRLRLPGDLIEVGFARLLEIDFYGWADPESWGEYSDTNRTLEFTLTSGGTAAANTIGYDYSARVRNASATI